MKRRPKAANLFLRILGSKIFFVVLFFGFSRAGLTASTRFIFGSCNDQNGPQTLWSSVIQAQPEAYLWLGDNIYADAKDPEVLKQKYRQLLNAPEYQALRDNIPVYGTWDDHDYGLNNSDKTNPIKVASQQLFLDFIGEPANSPRRLQEGIYQAVTFGKGPQQIKIIFLDTRYHQDPTSVPHADMLGDEQWAWLEHELQSSGSAMTWIASSISVLSPDIPKVEGWATHPESKKRLLALLKHYSGISGPYLFLTGDRHFSGYLKAKEDGIVYHEVMASGINKSLSWFLKPVMSEVYGGNLWYDPHVGVLDINWSTMSINFSNLTTGGLKHRISFSLIPKSPASF